RAVASLSGFSLLGFSGPEADAFLQAQTMNDVLELAPGRWHWNGWLNAKGRVIALFALVNLADGEFIAVLPDFPAAELATQLQRFVFRAKVRMQVLSELRVAGDQAPPPDEDAASAPDKMAGDPSAGLRLDFSGDGGRRHLWILPATHPALLAPASELDAQWMGADLAHGLPRLDAEQRESWTPQMLSLDRLRAYSLKKGCYPGQEIVARTHYLGQAKRGVRRVSGRDMQSGASLCDDRGNALGKLVCVTPDARSALAVLPVGQPAESVFVDGQAVAVVALLGGLQRPL
ncbi:MAG: folate-binding protein, partial [Arenimonas sp.]